MTGDFGLFGIKLQTLIANLNSEATALSVVVAAAILIFCLALVLSGLSEKTRRRDLLLPSPAGPAGGLAPGPDDFDLPRVGISAAFVQDLVASAATKGIPLAPLQTVLERLLERGVCDAEIPVCLAAAAANIEALRASLADWQDPGPGHERLRAEALALIDCGNLDAASDVLKRGREAGWTFPAATCREEAQFYAREAMIDHVQLRYDDAASKYGAAAALVAEHGALEVWHFLIAQGGELCGEGREFGSRESLLRAVEVYHRALGLVPRGQAPRQWAATKHRLGNALALLGESGREPDLLREAADAYLAALEEWTREDAPADWARAQNDLGNALLALGEQESDLGALRQAASVYRAALAEWTGESVPFDRAGAYRRLGEALAILGIEEEDRPRLTEAADAYRAALEGANPDVAPLDWAMTQNNLGNVLQALGESEAGSGRLHQAVAAYQAALQEHVLAPASFAATNNNLGNALAAIGERENSDLMLEKAVSAYRAALAVQPADAPPLVAAKTHMNLAYALGALWNRTRNRQALSGALDAAEEALALLGGVEEQDQVPAGMARQTILAAMGQGEAGMTPA